MLQPTPFHPSPPTPAPTPAPTPIPAGPYPLGSHPEKRGGRRRRGILDNPPSRVRDAHRSVLVEGVHGGQEGEDDSVALVVSKTKQHNLGQVTSRHATSDNVAPCQGKWRYERPRYIISRQVMASHITSRQGKEDKTA